MRLLPREHGATAIWLSSVLLAYGMLRELPWAFRVALFLATSLGALALIGKVTRSSRAIARMERNPVLLSVLSGLLTILVPLGQVLMVGQLSIHVLAIWAVFLTYCTLGVIYTRDTVRSVLKETRPTWTIFSLSAVLITLEIAILKAALAWLSIATLAVLVPLILHRVVVLSLFHRKGSSKVELIRGVGFAQAGNLMAVAIILAVVSRF
jgi:hypothetical protein